MRLANSAQRHFVGMRAGPSIAIQVGGPQHTNLTRQRRDAQDTSLTRQRKGAAPSLARQACVLELTHLNNA
jgi:hypothetical protein